MRELYQKPIKVNNGRNNMNALTISFSFIRHLAGLSHFLSKARNTFFLTGMFVTTVMTSYAQESTGPVSYSLTADIVSRYLWRGILFSPNVNIQPCLGVSYKGVTLCSWSSYAIADKYAEVDFILSYSYKNLTVLLSDYYNENELFLAENKHFNLNKDSTKHALETTVSYKISEAFPLNVLAAMFVYGNDRDEKGKNMYSTYFELSYPLNYSEFDFNLFMGGTTGKSIYANKAAVVYTGVTAVKKIKITESFKLPLSATIASNPKAEDVFFILKFSF